MKTILVIGAGRSSSSMIRYFLNNAEKEDWYIKVGDMDLEMAQGKVGNHARAQAFQFDALNENKRRQELEKVDFVVSMLPARFHVEVVKDCIDMKIDVITPSYVSAEMKELDEAAKAAGIIIMNEIGVDPGIDHMSAKKVLDEIADKNGVIEYFESFTGGLVAPESDDNPWNYKFTWNPRNVVLAGQGSAAKFIQQGQYKYIPYNKLFRRTEIIEVEGHGKFEGYANRDSLKYRSIYGLEDIPTIYRGTFRKVGFCRAWNVFVSLGATDDSYTLEGSKNMTKRDFINSFLAYNPHDSVELKLRHYMKIDHDDYIWDRLVWLGIFENEPLNLESDMTPAQILQKILEEKWSLKPDDKDMIVMWHKFGFTIDGELHEINSSMVCIGEDQTYTAMSETVGLPVAICTKMILNGTIQLKGVQLPIHKEIYEPVLKELEEYNVVFTEKEVEPKPYTDIVVM
ncbi:MAG: saccharopine dehydrogenase NADP-binding domain-containing protein [Flavobacteriales bacterium]|nr:saccharopine dehydrogenase NADP-binding domain-containing protein [Flavobacteriales bacterium]